jgi:hypothetical protein
MLIDIVLHMGMMECCDVALQHDCATAQAVTCPISILAIRIQSQVSLGEISCG